MRRLFINILAATSLLLMILASVMWVRSFQYLDTVSFYPPAIGTCDGYVFIGWIDHTESCTWATNGLLDHSHINRSDLWIHPIHKLWTDGFEDPSPQWTIAGVSFVQGENCDDHAAWRNGNPRTTYSRGWELYFPIWYLMIAFSVLPIWWLWGAWKHHLRQKRGHCTACGYDLRQTIGMCPECGAENSRQVKAKLD